MKAFLLPEIKEFMNLLLRSEVFDNFLLVDASIRTAATFTIDGHANPGFYSAGELEERHMTGLEYLPYGQLRHVCFELIKGRHVPGYFKFVLMLSPANLQNTIQAAETSATITDISGVYLNILYQNEQLILTTGVSYRMFIQDKSFDNEWDRFATNFLKKNSIIFSEI